MIKDNVTSINTIAQKSNRNSNSSLDSERQLTINSNNSIPEKRKRSSDQNIESLDKTTQSKSNKNNITNKIKVSISSPTVLKLTNEIDKQKELIIPKNLEFTIPINLKTPSNNDLQVQTNISFTTTPAVLKDQYSEFSSDQISATSNFFNYETKPRKHKNNNIINTSTGSYTSYREKLLITTKQRAPSFFKSDNSSSETHSAIQPKQLPRCRKTTNMASLILI